MINIFNNNKLQILSLLIAVTLTSSCKKFTEGETNDEELITTIKLNFNNGSNTQSFQIRDTDGPGGNAPMIDSIILNANTVYNVVIELLNESANPIENITEEVEEENESHRIYYDVLANTAVQVSNLNNDDNGVALGTESQWTTANVSTGSITVTLRHYPGTPPDKQASDPVNSPKSSTDVVGTFPVRIQ